MGEHCDVRAPDASRDHPRNLSRAANRHRQKFRPEEPKDLNFQVWKVIKRYKITFLTFKINIQITKVFQFVVYNGLQDKISVPIIDVFPICSLQRTSLNQGSFGLMYWWKTGGTRSLQQNNSWKSCHAPSSGLLMELSSLWGNHLLSSCPSMPTSGVEMISNKFHWSLPLCQGRMGRIIGR